MKLEIEAFTISVENLMLGIFRTFNCQVINIQTSLRQFCPMPWVKGLNVPICYILKCERASKVLNGGHNMGFG